MHYSSICIYIYALSYFASHVIICIFFISYPISTTLELS